VIGRSALLDEEEGPSPPPKELIDFEDPTLGIAESQTGKSFELPGRAALTSGITSFPLPFHLAGPRMGEEVIEAARESLDPNVRALSDSSSTNGGVGEI
jgi:hypothetical protein